MAASNFCSSCGAAVGPGARFCDSCGYHLVPAEGPAAVSNQPPGPTAAPASNRQFSPDGAWYWDGGQWQAVPPQLRLAAAARAVEQPAGPAPVVATPTSGPRARPPVRQWVQTGLILAALGFLEYQANWTTGHYSFPLLVVGLAALVLALWNPRGIGGLVTWAALVAAAGQLVYWYWYWTSPLWVAAVGVALVALTWRNPRSIGGWVTRLAAGPRLPYVRPGAVGRGAAAILALDLVAIPAAAGGWNAFTYFTSGYAVQLAGFATLAAPLTGAAIDVYQMTAGGRAGTLVGSTTTDKTGYYEFYANQPPGTTLLLETKGGAYVDEVTNKPGVVGPSDTLATIVLPNATTAFLTPLTTFATARAAALAASGQPLEAATQAAFTGIAQDYGLPELNSTFPSVATVPPQKQAWPSTLASRQLGLELAGLDAEAAALGVSDFALTDALAADISDGDFDGKAGKDQVYIGKPVSPSLLLAFADVVNPILPSGGGASGMCQFVGSPNNQLKDIPCPPVFAGPVEVGVNTGGLSWISTAALPAWRSGEAGTATVYGVGGRTPYTCALAGGSLPDGFALHSDCQITGTAPEVSNTRISGGFIVKMTDSSRPARSMSAELHITIVPKPPVVHISNEPCPAPNKPCNLAKFATATGGTPPYYFQKDVGGAFPPLGMLLWLDGSLRGKPKRAGVSDVFQVCAVDIGGSMSCTDATFDTLNPPSPSPTATPTSRPTEVPTSPPTVAPTAQPGGPSRSMPTDLPAGTYDIQVCQSSAIVRNSCFDAGTARITSTDRSNIQDVLNQSIPAYLSACGGGSVEYVDYGGGSFDVRFLCNAGGSGLVTVLTVRRVA